MSLIPSNAKLFWTSFIHPIQPGSGGIQLETPNTDYTSDIRVDCTDMASYGLIAGP